jgi:hypothetical protein
VAETSSESAVDYHFEADHADDSVIRAIGMVVGGLVVIGVVLVVLSLALAHWFG